MELKVGTVMQFESEKTVSIVEISAYVFPSFGTWVSVRFEDGESYSMEDVVAALKSGDLKIFYVLNSTLI